MKVKGLVLALLAATSAVAVQESITLERIYKLEDTEKYRIVFDADMAQIGQAKITVVLSNVVRKLYSNGDADVETSLKEMAIFVNGQEQSTDPARLPKGRVQKQSKLGIPVGESVTKGNIMGMDYLRFATILPDKPIAVGQTLDFTHKMDRTEVKGSTKLEKLENGTATLSTKMTLNQPNNLKPVPLEFIAKVEQKTGKIDVVEGTVALPDEDIKNMKFKMERLPK